MTDTIPSTTPTPITTQTLAQEIEELKAKLAQAKVPDELRLQTEKEIARLERSAQLGSYDEKYERISKYLDWIVNLPWEAKSQDVLDLARTKQVFDQHHFGLQEVKDRFIEYVAMLKLKSQT